jgi:phosphate transport system substrate-binding protein
MKDRKYVSTQLEKNSNGAVKQTIAQTPGAIGYVSIGFVDTTVKPVGIEVNKTVVQPTVANVKSKAYPVSRDLYLLTRGQPSPVEKTFIDYVLSAEGQKLVQDEGYVPVSS